MKKKPLIKILVGTLTISVLLMVFCLPTMAAELEVGQLMPNINYKVYDFEKYSYWDSKVTIGTKNSITNITADPNQAQKEFVYREYETNTNGNFITFPDSGGNYATYFSIQEEYIYTSDNPYKYYDAPDVLPEEKIETFYINTTTRLVFPREQIKELPTNIIKPEIKVRTTSADETIDFTIAEGNIKINLNCWFTNSNRVDKDTYGDLIVIDVYTSIKFDPTKYLYVTSAGENDIYITRVYIDYKEQLQFKTAGKVKGALTYKALMLTDGDFTSTSPSQNATNQGNIGDIFIAHQENEEIKIKDTTDKLEYDALDAIAGSQEYIFWGTFFAKIWTWGHAETMVLAVLVFGIASFVIFGKKG